jgi:hypothetical protein
MADPIVGAAPPLARRAIDEQQEQALASLLVFVVVVAILCDPGVLVGMALAQLVWTATRPGQPYRWTSAAMAAGAVIALHQTTAPAWPWRAMFSPVLAAALHAQPVSRDVALHSVAIEALAGPLLLQLALTARALRRRVLRQRLEDEERRPGGSGEGRRALAPFMMAQLAGPPNTEHPPGAIRLGVDVLFGAQFDVSDVDLGQHVFLPGLSGSGKTTTIARLADGALELGWSVVIVDCKAGGLGAVAASLATAHHVPFAAVDPDRDDSLGYDICTGDPAAVANKLLGAFAYEGAAEVYKHAAMEAIPVVLRAMHATGDPVTLAALHRSFDRGGLGQLGRRAGEPHAARLAALEQSGQVGQAAYSGLQRRLGALLEGRFGDILRDPRALDWERQLRRPSVTYVGLSATASSEDVELMGRVIAQDLKQVAGRRIRDGATDSSMVPALVVFDEFAALREAEQVVDLLLQARQARFSLVVSTQYLPESIPLRKTCLGAGLVIAHRLESDDAEAVAAQFGTRSALESTLQYDKETGYSAKGSVRNVEQYHLHPNELRDMPVGHAAVRSAPTSRRAVVRIHRRV